MNLCTSRAPKHAPVCTTHGRTHPQAHSEVLLSFEYRTVETTDSKEVRFLRNATEEDEKVPAQVPARGGTRLPARKKFFQFQHHMTTFQDSIETRAGECHARTLPGLLKTDAKFLPSLQCSKTAVGVTGPLYTPFSQGKHIE